MVIHRNWNHRLLTKFSKQFRCPSDGSPELYYLIHQHYKVSTSAGNVKVLNGDALSPPFLVEGEDWVLPLSLGRKEEDQSIFLVVHYELTIPDQSSLWFENGMLTELARSGVLLDPRGREELTVAANQDFPAVRPRIWKGHRKVLDTFQCASLLDAGEREGSEIIAQSRDLDEFYEDYWEQRASFKQGLLPHEEGYFQSLLHSGLLSMTSIHKDSRLLGLAYFVKLPNGEYYWTMAKRDTSPEFEAYSLGNSLICILLEQLQNRSGAFLNLGVGWLEYKRKWKPVSSSRPSLVFVSSSHADSWKQQIEGLHESRHSRRAFV